MEPIDFDKSRQRLYPFDWSKGQDHELPLVISFSKESVINLISQIDFLMDLASDNFQNPFDNKFVEKFGSLSDSEIGCLHDLCDGHQRGYPEGHGTSSDWGEDGGS